MAIVQALMWLTATAETQHTYIHTDCETAIDICNGTATSSADEHLSRFLKVLYDMVRTETHVTLVHVPSHGGMPWNELADGLSKKDSKTVRQGRKLRQHPV
eukprot:3593275-Pyramimonas_sp.AAC.1